MKAVKITVNKSSTGFRPLEKMPPVPLVERKVSPEKTEEPLPYQTGFQVERIAPVTSGKKPRVCCYCRVSTFFDSQETSLEGQRDHYERMIKENPDWEFAGTYLEAGVSGTKTEVRPELQRLIEDCRAGKIVGGKVNLQKIDLILTKSISRFARNTSDCLEMVRLLTSLGVSIHFEKEKIHTDEMHSEFMLSVLACLAEDESRSISGNVKWSIQKRFQEGTYKQAIAPYGYEWEGMKLVVIPYEAEVVKEIFRMCMEGNSCLLIARELNRRGIASPRGGEWNQETIRHMLKNLVYTGDFLFQKTYIDDTFHQRINRGELDQYYDEGHHEPIICKEDFVKAQDAITQRARGVGYNGEVQNRSSNRYCFSSILFCKDCGTAMHRNTSEKADVCWKCYNHVLHPQICHMKPQSESDLKRAFINCLNKLAWSQRKGQGVLDLYETLLGKTESEKNAERLVEIEEELTEIRNELQKQNAILLRERFMAECQEKKQALLRRADDLMAERNKILVFGTPDGTLESLQAFIGGWKVTDDPGAFPEKAFSEYVDHCTVDSGEAVMFHFRCGLHLTESLKRSRLEEKK